MARFEEGGVQKNRPRVARVVFNVVALLIRVILSREQRLLNQVSIITVE